MTVDGQARNAFPAMRVFVFGVEVTADVSSCTIVAHDGRQPNTCEFVLASPLDRYTITEQDIHALYDTVDISEVDVPDFLPTAPFRLSTSSPYGATDSDSSMVTNGLVQNRHSAIIESTQVARDELDRLIRDRVTRDIADELKANVLRTKIVERFEGVLQPDISQTGKPFVETSIARLAALRGDALRYPWQVGECVFHSNDAVRVFWRDPFDPNIWYHMFAGYASDFTDSVSVNNERLVTVRCEDVSRVLRYARITTNPGLFDLDAIAAEPDAAIRTFFNDSFSGLTLSEFLYTVVFGSEATGIDPAQLGAQSALSATPRFTHKLVSVNGTTTISTETTGSGAFNYNRSRTFTLGSSPAVRATTSLLDASTSTLESIGSALGGVSTFKSDPFRQLRDRITPIDNLYTYQRNVDHRVRESDLDDMVLPSEAADIPALKASLLRRVDGTIKPEEIITTIGRNPHLFPVEGRLVLLQPESLGPDVNRTLLTKDIANGINLYTTWKNRLALIYDVVQRIEFSFYASPKGDLICEMPLYDFQPEDFGQDSTSEYSRAFNVQKHDTISWDKTFTDERVRTQMTAYWSTIDGLPETGGNSQTIGEEPAVVFLKHLVPQFGVRAEQADVKGFISTKEAAQVYCEVKLNQWNADARSARVEVIPRPSLMFPNRPLEFATRAFIATTRKITHSLVWGASGDMGMSLDVNYIRGWDGQVEGNGSKKRRLYAPLGGFAARPLNYAIELGSSRPNESTQPLSTRIDQTSATTGNRGRGDKT